MNAIAIRATTSTPSTTSPSVVITASAKPPREIANGILALPIAFPSGRSLDQGERDLLAMFCLEALEGFEVFIADLVLRRIRLFAPNNPFRPTPQDLKEYCDRTRNALRHAVWHTAVCGDNWRFYSSKLPSGWFGDPGSEPFTPGCLVPDDIASKWIRDRISRDAEIDEMQRFIRIPYEDARWATAPEFLRRTSASAVRNLPDDALPAGFREVHEAAACHQHRLIEHRRRELGENWD